MSVEAVSHHALKGGAHAVTSALSHAAEATGVDFDVLYHMARRESSLNPEAKAKTSSAAGLFQFIDQTWLGMVKKHGARYGLADETAAITRSPSGKYVVDDPKQRDHILNLRFNPVKAAALAGELINENRQGLERRLGRAVNNAEIYAAHFLGAGGAARLLKASGDAKAAELLPKAAAANRAVFYDGARARTVNEVIASIAKSMGEEPGVAAPASLETKSASFGETAFSARAAYAPPANARRTDELLARGYALAGERGAQAMTPLRLAVLDAIDPTRLGARGDDDRRA